MAVPGAIYFTGAFTILLHGLYWKRATVHGAFAALVVGLFAVLGLEPVQKLFGLEQFLEKDGIGSAHIGLGVALLSIVVMVGVSAVTPTKNQAGRPTER